MVPDKSGLVLLARTSYILATLLLSGLTDDMERKPKSKTTLTATERHKRFVEMAREVDASDDPKDFEKAFKRVTFGKRAVPKKGHR